MIGRMSVAILAMALMASGAEADPAKLAPACPKEDGRIEGPYVPTKEAAAKIYLIVGQAMFPKLFPTLRKKYPIVSVDDEGEKWSVGQSSPPPKKAQYTDKKGNQYIVVSAGGGMLNMSIDKCTSTISEMSFAR